jgi:hypothetical protein
MTHARSLAVGRRWVLVWVTLLIASLATSTANAANVIERIDALTLGTDQDNVRSAVVDTANGFAYFGTFTVPGRVVKVDLSTFQAVDEIVLEENENDLRSAVIDTASGHAYFGTSTNPGRVVKIDLDTFTRVGAITLNDGESHLQSAALDPTDGLEGALYFSTYTSPIKVVKIDLSTFLRDDAVTLDTGENLSGAMLIDPGNGYAYVGTASNVIVRVGLSPFARIDTLTLPVNEFTPISGFTDAANGYAYFGTSGTGSVVKVDLSTFTRVGAINTGDGRLYTADFDPGTGYAYFGTNTIPGRVVAIDLDTFTEVGSDVLDAGEDSIYSAVLDAGAGYAYFGTFTDPGQVVRVRVGLPMATVGLVNPATGQWHLRNALGVVTSFYFGNPNDYPFMGDWDCNGIDTPGLYRQSDGFAYLRNSNTQGVANISFFFGNPGDIPIVGDFNDDGCDTVSIYRPSQARFYIINALGTNGGGLGPADYYFDFGNPGDQPFSGDFDADGYDEVGLHRASTGLVYYEDELIPNAGGGQADHEFFFGNPGDRFVAGDWNRNGSDSPAVFRPGNTTFYFRYTNTQGNADEQFSWEGSSTWLPVSGAFGLG